MVSRSRGLDTYCTHIKGADGSQRVRNRTTRFAKTYNDTFQVTIHPSVIVTNYTTYKISRKRYTFMNYTYMGNITNSSMQGFPTGCACCGDILVVKCEHGNFCHGHACEECWGSDGVQCHHDGCEGAAGFCPEGKPHCTHANHVCPSMKNAWNTNVN